jgi:hypothetical protein
MPTSPRVAVIVMVAMVIVLHVDPVLTAATDLQALVEIGLVDLVVSVLLVTVRPVGPVQKGAHLRVDLDLTVRLAIAQLVDHVLKVAVLTARTAMLAVQSALPRAEYTVTP